MGTVLLGKWCIERLIGIGGMGAVYEARHRNQSRVAVKVIHGSSGLSSAQVSRFKREGYAANRVAHPGVVEIYDDDVDERGAPFLVMELLLGQTVAELAAARGGSLAPPDVLDLAEQLLDVLAAAHEKGILHRDIKPENLFVTTNGGLKVLDFGIARLADPELGWARTMDGTLLGTPAFSAPEQARGRIDEIDERSDLWAVGATLFTLLTGRFVHETETPNEQLGAAMLTDAPSLATVAPSLPTALVVLVDRALSYERSDRWANAREMQDAVRWLRRAWPTLGDEPTRVPPGWRRRAVKESSGRTTFGEGSTWSPSPRSNGRWRRHSPLALGATIALAAVLIWQSRTSARSTNRLVPEGAPRLAAKVTARTPEGPLAAGFVVGTPPPEPVHAPKGSAEAISRSSAAGGQAVHDGPRHAAVSAPTFPLATVERVDFGTAASVETASTPPLRSGPLDRRH